MTEPLTDPAVDVAGLPGFMLNVVRLLSSELVAISTGDEFKAAVLLWCRSWQQTPACSLPDDDRVLASFAGLGADVKKWRKVRDVALRGFVRCSDGRLYHPVLVEDAKRASKARQQRRDAIARRYGSDNGKPTAVAGPVLPVQRRDETRRDETEEREGESAPPLASPPAPVEPAAKQSRGSRMTKDWALPDDWRQWATDELLSSGSNLPAALDWIPRAADRFRDHWCAKAGKDGVKLDWEATWRNWIRRDIENGKTPRGGANGKTDAAGSGSSPDYVARVLERQRARFGPGSAGGPGADAGAVLPAAPGGQ